MSERVKIHIDSSGQDTTATLELINVKSRNRCMCTLSNIENFEWVTFWNFSKVEIKFNDGRTKESVFYYNPHCERLQEPYPSQLDYWTNKEEGKETTMTHKVTITTKEEKTVEEYYMMRGISESQNIKKVIAERETAEKPTLEEIAQFLADSKADFVAVSHNYRFAKGD